MFNHPDTSWIVNVASHLPDLTTMDVFIDVLSLCNFCILSNVLDPRTYSFPDRKYREAPTATHILQRQQHDYNALSPSDRLYFSYVRGLAINLIYWLDSRYAFKDDKENVHAVMTQARMYLHRQVRAILCYKRRAEVEHVDGVPNCTSKDLRRQIDLLFADGEDELLGQISPTTSSDTDTLSWETNLRPAMFRQSQPFSGNIPPSFQCFVIHIIDLNDYIECDPHKTGTTKGDKMFHTGSAQLFPLSDVVDVRMKGPNSDDEGSSGDDEGSSEDDEGSTEDDEGSAADDKAATKGTDDEQDESSDDDEESVEDEATGVTTGRVSKTLGKRKR